MGKENLVFIDDKVLRSLSKTLMALKIQVIQLEKEIKDLKGGLK